VAPKRYFILDILRIFSMFMVILWHWKLGSTIPPYQSFVDFSVPGLPIIENSYLLNLIASAGFLGVDLFFILSGAVIYLSIGNRSPLEFLVARFKRLFPAYILVLLFTAIIYRFQSIDPISISEAYSSVILGESYNFASLPTRPIIAAGWTLIIEISFYFSVFILLIIREIMCNLLKFKVKIEAIFLFWGAVIYCEFGESLNSLFVNKNYISYFLAGAILMIAAKFKYFIARFIFFYLASLLVFQTLNLRIQSTQGNILLSNFGSLSITLIISFLIYMSSLDSLNSKLNNSFIALISKSTYPFYLMHQQIGIFFAAIIYTKAVIPINLVYFITFVIITSLSLLINIYWEPFIRKRINFTI
jgi:peptidoglycan/LPS O-acetylase OafA/YrhL